MKFTALVEDKVDKLKMILESLKGVEEDDEPKEKKTYIEVDDDNDDDKPKRKPKKKAPEIIFIFDDLSKTMRNPTFTWLIKTNRHYFCKTIISSQNVKDIHPDARENIDFLIIFKGIKNDLLESIYEDFNVKLDYDTFIKVYKVATEKKHSFLFINTREHEYRKNFNSLFLLNQN